jgi:hypothetical protein
VWVLDKKVKMLWNLVIEMVKVQWTYYSPKDDTPGNEDSMWAEYQQRFE